MPVSVFVPRSVFNLHAIFGEQRKAEISGKIFAHSSPFEGPKSIRDEPLKKGNYHYLVGQVFKNQCHPNRSQRLCDPVDVGSHSKQHDPSAKTNGEGIPSLAYVITETLGRSTEQPRQQFSQCPFLCLPPGTPGAHACSQRRSLSH